MGRYLLRRTVQIIVTLFVFETLLFFVLQAMPGDITQALVMNPDIPPEARARLQHELGLDRPLFEQYLHHLWNLITFKGVSFGHYPRTVLDIVKERAPRTIVLFLTSTLVSFSVGFATGKVLAWKRGGLVEYGTTIGGVILYTVFTPWFALIMIWIFASKLHWFPTGKFLDPELWRQYAPENINANMVFNRMLLNALIAAVLLFILFMVTRAMVPYQRRVIRWGGGILMLVATIWFWASSGIGRLALDIVHHIVLPVITLTLISFAGTMLLTRNSMLETLREDYILTAKAKGLPEKVVRDKHAARNALLPVVTSLVLSLAFVISGGVITETIFSWPGMGLTLLQASLTEDIPLAMGALTFTAILALVAHLLADILYAYLDPRIRYQ